jgi:hypothetical protein
MENVKVELSLDCTVYCGRVRDSISRHDWNAYCSLNKVYDPPCHRLRYDARLDQPNPDSWRLGDLPETSSENDDILQKMKAAGAEIRHQEIPEKRMDDGLVRPKRLLIEVFTQVKHLPAVKDALKGSRLYLQTPPGLDASCLHYNFHSLNFKPLGEFEYVVSEDGLAWAKTVVLPPEVVQKMDRRT